MDKEKQLAALEKARAARKNGTAKEKPEYKPRASGRGIEGISISAKKPITPPRMRKILGALGKTMEEYKYWCGFSPKEWCAVNFNWTEREWYELISENIDTPWLTS